MRAPILLLTAAVLAACDSPTEPTDPPAEWEVWADTSVIWGIESIAAGTNLFVAPRVQMSVTCARVNRGPAQRQVRVRDEAASFTHPPSVTTEFMPSFTLSLVWTEGGLEARLHAEDADVFSTVAAESDSVRISWETKTGGTKVFTWDMRAFGEAHDKMDRACGV